MSDTTGMVWISEEEYNLLLERDAFLAALETSGVYDWEGYGEALDSLDEEGEDK